MLAHMSELRGVFAAAVTPLLDGGTRLDEPGIGQMADFLADGGVDGALVCGTAGEGMLLAVAERRRALETYLAAAGARFAIMAHCGAQTTADTAALAAHAAEAGARRRLGHRAAVLPAGRARTARAPGCGGERVRSAAVLHLRVHGA